MAAVDSGFALSHRHRLRWLCREQSLTLSTSRWWGSSRDDNENGAQAFALLLAH
jgi:hypothetical protein